MAFHGRAIRKHRLHITNQSGATFAQWSGFPPHESGGQGGPLPEVVVIRLRNRRAEPALKLRLQRAQLPPLPLEAAVRGKVEMYLEDADEAQLSARPGQDSVCSTCLVS
jgi:hypothetical protein